MGSWSDEQRERNEAREVAFRLGAQSRDAEIERLKAEVAQMRRWGKERNDELCAIIDEERKINARLRRALAAGPADLRGFGGYAALAAADIVETAQKAAMKEDN